MQDANVSRDRRSKDKKRDKKEINRRVHTNSRTEFDANDHSFEIGTSSYVSKIIRI